MRFLFRAFGGLLILGLTLGLGFLALGEIAGALRERAERTPPVRVAKERVIAVRTAVFVRETVEPVVTAYGTVENRRSLDLRAAAPGTLVELSAAFRDGGRVEAGEVLYRIDPADARSARDNAAATRAEAEAEIAEAAAALLLAREDLAAAERQRDLRAVARDRQRELQGRKVATEASVETAELAHAAAEQALVARRQAFAQAEARVTRAALARDRAALALADAGRALDDTVYEAPFGGLLTGVTAVPGRRVTVNEALGRLLDPAAIELAFRVSNNELARILNATGALRQVRVRATLDLGAERLVFAGRVERAGAEVGAGNTGRLLYASLETGADSILRPGDFMTVEMVEPPLDGVSVIPAGAITEDGRVLVLTADSRLAEIRLAILRRQRDSVIVGGAPEGTVFVTDRLPTMSPGLKVRPTGLDAPEAAEAPAPAMVRLTPERRAALIAAVETNTRMPPDVRVRILARLNEDEVPREMIERLEARIGG